VAGDEQKDASDGFRAHYIRGLQNSSRHNAAAYGYSVAATASFGALSHIVGAATLVDCFVYVIGAGIGFAIVNALASKGYRQQIPEEPPVVILLGTSFNVVSTTAAVGVVVGVAYALGDWAAWPVATFAFTVVYLFATALELGLAAQMHSHGGVEGERSRGQADEEAA
jgi:hypothetical protein